MTTKTIPTMAVCAFASVMGCAADKDAGATATGEPSETSGSADDDGDDDDESDDEGKTTDPTVEDSGTDDEDSSTTEDNTFIQKPDGGGAAHECDLWAQDCPQNEKCMPWVNDGGGSWNATKCVPLAANPGSPGDPCTVEGNGGTGLDDCDATSMCWNVDAETNIGVCQPFCSGSEANPVCSDTSTTCVINNGGAIILCLPICDPLLNECPPDEGCYPTPTEDAFICIFDANGSEDGLYGDACMFANVCNPGLHCTDAAFVPDCDTPACCTSYCDLSEDDPNATCPGADGGQECIPWFPENAAPPGFEDLGACQIPT